MWILVCGERDDYHIIGTFSDYTAAQKIQERFAKMEQANDYRLEEWPLDGLLDCPEGCLPWMIQQSFRPGSGMGVYLGNGAQDCLDAATEQRMIKGSMDFEMWVFAENETAARACGHAQLKALQQGSKDDGKMA